MHKQASEAGALSILPSFDSASDHAQERFPQALQQKRPPATLGKKWRRCANRIAFTGWMPNYEVLSHEELFIDLKGHLPKELIYERELLIYRM